MNAHDNQERDEDMQQMGEDMQQIRRRILEMITMPYSLQELSRQVVLKAMGVGKIVEKIKCLKEEENLPLPVVNFLARNLSTEIN